MGAKKEIAQEDQRYQARKTIYRRTAVAGLLAALLGLLAVLSRQGPMGWELALTRWLQSLPLPLGLMEALSVPGKWWVAVPSTVALAGLAAWARSPRIGLLLVTVLPVDALNEGLQAIIGRGRPSDALVRVLEEGNGGGFPSGHVVHTALLLGLLASWTGPWTAPPWVRWPLRLLLAAAILGTGVSRIYLGAHWPADVLGAYLLAGIFLLWGTSGGVLLGPGRLSSRGRPRMLNSLHQDVGARQKGTGPP